eukprot:scaffold60862_cov41-Cyclotella_meneghiniana.AAC.9
MALSSYLLLPTSAGSDGSSADAEFRDIALTWIRLIGGSSNAAAIVMTMVISSAAAVTRQKQRGRRHHDVTSQYVGGGIISGGVGSAPAIFLREN